MQGRRGCRAAHPAGTEAGARRWGCSTAQRTQHWGARRTSKQGRRGRHLTVTMEQVRSPRGCGQRSAPDRPAMSGGPHAGRSHNSPF
eukprot:15144604-Alexandrium_andersonii.AAC.1